MQKIQDNADKWFNYIENKLTIWKILYTQLKLSSFVEQNRNFSKYSFKIFLEIFWIYSGYIRARIVKNWQTFFSTKLNFSLKKPFSKISSKSEIKILGISHQKELSLCHTLGFSNPYIFATPWHRPQKFQTKNPVRLNYLSLKYVRFTPSGCKYIEIRKFEFVAKTQFLCEVNV